MSSESLPSSGYEQPGWQVNLNMIVFSRLLGLPYEPPDAAGSGDAQAVTVVPYTYAEDTDVTLFGGHQLASELYPQLHLEYAIEVDVPERPATHTANAEGEVVHVDGTPACHTRYEGIDQDRFGINVCVVGEDRTLRPLADGEGNFLATMVALSNPRFMQS